MKVVVAPYQNLEKTNSPILRPERGKDAHTLFVGPMDLLPLTQ